MTDTPPTDADAASDAETIADGDGATVQRSGWLRDLTWPELRRKLLLAAILGLALLAAWASFQVYVSVSRAVGLWISRDFVPIFQAVFNAAVVAVAIAGILRIRRGLA